MMKSQDDPTFDTDEIAVVSRAVATAEDLVSDYYKLSASAMRRLNYDVKTAAALLPHEIVEAHFAQIVRYRAEKRDSLLKTDVQDFYKICIQDHAILSAIARFPEMDLHAFLLYVICHELVHVVRFQRFEQQFHVPDDQKQAEEIRVHRITHQILSASHIAGMQPVLNFYESWRNAPDRIIS